ncbi:hypothetical protein GCM10018779_33390 [Streptomyces griseocarneus]|nr:hypothetical protein GCM10018779_33390 [Streptomyces griseocarneus]
MVNALTQEGIDVVLVAAVGDEPGASAVLERAGAAEGEPGAALAGARRRG